MLQKLLLLALVFILSACSVITAANPIPHITEDEAEILERLSVERIYETIEVLTKEPRVAGTEAEKNASSFLVDQLEQIGYEAVVQPFEIDSTEHSNFGSLEVEGFPSSLSVMPFNYSAIGTAVGELVDAGHGRDTDYSEINVEGKIVLISKSDLPFNDVLLNASVAGASAVVIYFNEGDSIVDRVSVKPSPVVIPALALSHNEGITLLELSKENAPVIGNLVVEDIPTINRQSQNIIATKQITTDKSLIKPILILGAHYDSVPESPGASDNASGTSVLLEVARLVKELPMMIEIRFLFFGSEEIGMLGSEKYINELSTDEIERTIAMFNFDMVGSNAAGPLTMFLVEGESNIVTKVGSKANEKLSGKGLRTKYTAKSDHTAFHNIGIESAVFTNFPLEKWYHSSDDTIGKLSKERLELVAQLIVLSILELSISHIDSN